ncbi:hypothetical protein [Ferrimonas balearica]|uniref:hypothetical protein n=1 Tax=Ferrimonas balearica TaxID=44012 RepID=UPI001C9924A9|nr:hypothetical protein [Ferrimonas balearica]MBY5991498.1 hypothetical protein [Ferrimonas balearica]
MTGKGLISLLLLCSPALAAEHPCEPVGEMAEAVMLSRQLGTPMAEVMFDAEVALLREMVIAAYIHPRWPEQARQTRAVAQFRDRFERRCNQAQGPRP